VVLVEVGPGRALTGHVRHAAAGGAGPPAVPLLGRRGGGCSELQDVTTALADLWVIGAEVDWERVSTPRRRVALPTYPFERRRFWPEHQQAVRRPAATVPDAEPTIYVPGWRSSQRPPAAPPPGGNWLVLAPDNDPLTAAVVALLASAAGHVDLAVRPGRRQPEAGQHRVDPRDPDAFPALLRELERAGRPPDRILHAWSIGRSVDALAVEPQRSAGFDALIGLARGLAGRDRPVAVDIVASELFAVEGGDRVSPAKALVLGPALVLPQEQPGVGARVIDVDRDVRPAELLDELLGGREHIVALRGARRWTPDYQPLAAAAGARPDRLAAARTILITGGLGRIGIALAEHLARTRGANTVLLGRTTSTRDGRSAAEISAGVARLGGQALVVPGDVADETALLEAWRQAADRFGAVDAVFHCAGVVSGASFAPAHTLDPASRDEQLRPKVLGTLALARTLRQVGACPVIAASSLAATLGGPDFGAYAAANAYLDAFAASMAGAGWTSIGWDGWRFPGEAERPGTPALTPAVALQALDDILAAPAMPALVVCAGGLAERRRRWVDGVSTPRVPPIVASRRAIVAPRTAAERAIAAILRELLHVDEVGVDDEFLDLGGHSLLALYAIGRIRERLGVELGLAEFLDARTVERLALLVERALTERLDRFAATAGVDGAVAADVPAGVDGAAGAGDHSGRDR